MVSLQVLDQRPLDQRQAEITWPAGQPRPASSPPTGTPQGKRALGLGSSSALVIGNMTGSGIFLLPAALAAYGGISILGWIFTAVGARCLALVGTVVVALVYILGTVAVITLRKAQGPRHRAACRERGCISGLAAMALSPANDVGDRRDGQEFTRPDQLGSLADG